MKPDAIRKMIFGLLGLMVLGAFCAWLLQEQLTIIGEWFIGKYGLWGIGIGTLITDTSPIPLTSEPIAMLALASNVSVWQVIVVSSIASHLGAPVSYTGGYFLGKQNWFQQIIAKRFPEWNEQGPEYAIKLVIIGALLPVPYAITVWFAGSVQADFKKVFLVASFRWVKNFVSILMLAGGWQLGSG